MRIHGPNPDSAAGDFNLLPPTARAAMPTARILIFREQSQHIPGSMIDELITLAHEAGHWSSWRCEEWPDSTRYAAAVDDKVVRDLAAAQAAGHEQSDRDRQIEDAPDLRRLSGARFTT